MAREDDWHGHVDCLCSCFRNGLYSSTSSPFSCGQGVWYPVFEFAGGLRPALASTTWRGTKYSLRVFPLGGFVKMAGMDEPVDYAEDVPLTMIPGVSKLRAFLWAGHH